ncbi:hypothetical protein CCNA_03914 [Caulobacter vibrioides NA1000]
MVKAR